MDFVAAHAHWVLNASLKNEYLLVLAGFSALSIYE